MIWLALAGLVGLVVLWILVGVIEAADDADQQVEEQD